MGDHFSYFSDKRGCREKISLYSQRELSKQWLLLQSSLLSHGRIHNILAAVPEGSWMGRELGWTPSPTHSSSILIPSVLAAAQRQTEEEVWMSPSQIASSLEMASLRPCKSSSRTERDPGKEDPKGQEVDKRRLSQSRRRM